LLKHQSPSNPESLDRFVAFRQELHPNAAANLEIRLWSRSVEGVSPVVLNSDFPDSRSMTWLTGTAL
jgi:hypothetical protein